MKRLLPRIFCVGLIAFAIPARADIPMVTTPMVLPVVRALPELPTPERAEFSGVTHVAVRSGDDVAEHVDVAPQIDLSAFGTPCDLSVDIVPVDQAMMALSVVAPCQPHASVHVSHGGVHYEAAVSLTGTAQMTFPAMTREAEVFVAVGEEIFERRVTVEGAEHFARIALVGTTGLELGATAPTGAMPVYRNQDLQMFSVDMRLVEVAKTYRLTLRHEVTAETCDQPVHTHLRRILPGRAESDVVLRLAAQDCARVGDILELKNIVPDLKLAAN